MKSSRGGVLKSEWRLGGVGISIVVVTSFWQEMGGGGADQKETIDIYGGKERRVRKRIPPWQTGKRFPLNSNTGEKKGTLTVERDDHNAWKVRVLPYRRAALKI